MIPGLQAFELNTCHCGSEITSDRSVTCYPCGQFDYLIAKTIVFNRLGWDCNCCGSDYSPQADHIDGSGKKHREADPFAKNLIRWLVHYGVPDGFQTLCQPCNGSKGNGLHCKRHRKYLGPVQPPQVVVNITVNVTVGWEALAA